MSSQPQSDLVHAEVTAPCPCQGGGSYGQCCGPVHAGAAAADASALMRSRYCAFVLGDVDYLLASWHSSTRPPPFQIEPDRRWLGLKLVASRESGPDRAEVEFIARYRLGGGRAIRHHELSRFQREGGRWTYLDGAMQDS